MYRAFSQKVIYLLFILINYSRNLKFFYLYSHLDTDSHIVCLVLVMFPEKTVCLFVIFFINNYFSLSI